MSIGNDICELSICFDTLVGSWSLASLRDIGHALYPNLAIDQSNVLISDEFSREGTIEGSRLTLIRRLGIGGAFQSVLGAVPPGGPHLMKSS